MNADALVSPARVLALLRKEAQDVLRSRAALLPGVMTLLALIVPFAIAVGVPIITGEPLSSDDDVQKGLELARRHWPDAAGLGGEALVQAFFFQQFLMMVLLVPVSGSMALAAHSVIGEKQARTLEPLLATPLTTADLLVAKVLAALLPALVMEVVATALYFGGIALLGAPGVAAALATPRTGLLLLVLGPLFTFVALLVVVIASSRTNDARGAQQFGTFVVIPIVGVMIAQGTGAFWLTLPVVLGVAVALVAVAVVLLWFGVAVFERERILTRWK
jgi:ABC-2 type transport system permease protein